MSPFIKSLKIHYFVFCFLNSWCFFAFSGIQQMLIVNVREGLCLQRHIHHVSLHLFIITFVRVSQILQGGCLFKAFILFGLMHYFTFFSVRIITDDVSVSLIWFNFTVWDINETSYKCRSNPALVAYQWMMSLYLVFLFIFKYK